MQLAIDDFCTGDASLEQLKQQPVSRLKIAQSSVRGIPGSTDDAVIAATIIKMGQSLRMQVLAAGVETVEQYRFLRNAGCQEAQGDLFGRARPDWSWSTVCCARAAQARSTSRPGTQARRAGDRIPASEA